jgi:branched-chain amino acid transport system substrate-binding protein
MSGMGPGPEIGPGIGRRSVLAAAAAALGLITLAGQPVLAKDVKICLIAGKTGALEAYAKQTENGFMMGLEYLTQGSNKVGNDKLEVIVKDDQLKPDRGKTLLEECYGDDKADLAVGTTGSPVALAMLPVAEEHKKVLIVEPAVADSITGDKWNRYIFRTGRSSYQDALAGAAAYPKTGEVAVGMLGLDTAFGRDGVAAFKQALASIRPNVKVVAEEYAAGATADFAPFAERLFNALKDKPGKKVIGFIWAGPHPMAKFVDMKPERFGIELAPGGNILPVMNSWKQFAGTEGGIYYYYDFPKNPENDWLKTEYQKRYGAPPDFFVAGGFAAAAAVVAALKQAGSSDSEKLIAAMEGLTFATPKGPMTFRKEDHQALQDMYHFRIKKDAKDNDVLELVGTIAANEMPLPVRTKR